jgi:MYXO-CTERM domain-containing protein
MELWKKTLLGAVALTGASMAQAEIVDFDIVINFTGGLSDSQQTVFQDAENYWESILVGYADSVSFAPSLIIDASGEDIDGQSGVLGQAGPTYAEYNRVQSSDTYNLLYALNGTMKFDTADLDYMEDNGTLYAVIVHEMAHVIGFGTLWTYNDLYTDGTGEYVGEYALAQYQEEFDADATYVPVEQDGGDGTEDAHWDESWAGGSADLMTGYLEGITTLSDTTLAAFQDLGYAVTSLVLDEDDVSNVSSPLLGLGGLFMLALARRRAK